MPNISELAAKFPANELTVHRLYSNSESFRAVYADYLEASNALDFWRSKTPAATDKIEDYQKIMDELEKEMADIIEQTECIGERRQR
ncbi:MAG: hypothetical protein ABJI96_22375 [Paracoccaceae bacterium]